MYIVVPLQLISFGSGSHCPISTHVDVLDPVSSFPGFKKLNETIVPTTAGLL